KPTTPRHGCVTLHPDETLPSPLPYTTPFRSSFTYKACDNGTTNGSPDGKCSGTATVSLTVTPVNDAPAANNDSATVAEGGTVTVHDSTARLNPTNDPNAEANTLPKTKLSDPA